MRCKKTSDNGETIIMSAREKRTLKKLSQNN